MQCLSCGLRRHGGFSPAGRDRRFWKAGVIGIVVLGSLFMLTSWTWAAPGGSSSQPVPSATELVAQIVESEKQIRDIQLHTTYTIPPTNTVLYESDWGYDRGKEFLAQRTTVTAPDGGSSWVEQEYKAFDGQMLRILNNSPRQGSIWAPGSRSSYFVQSTTIMFPTLLGYGANGTFPRLSLGEAISRAESVTVRKRADRIKGHPCYVVEARGVDVNAPEGRWSTDIRAWIDFERGYRALRIDRDV
jgi:hypothetical protein